MLTISPPQMFHPAVELGRKWQSKQTGFVHYCFEEPSSRDTIPILENFTFALALLRLRQGETILEAKELLQRLLLTQTKEGGFPVYLHEFPKIRKSLANVDFLFPLLHIYEGYRHVLGKEMTHGLEKAIESLNHYLKTLGSMPPLLAFQIGAFESRYYGKEKPKLPTNLITSKEYGDTLLAAHILQEELVIPWHSGTNQFAGPPLHELFDGFAPRFTLLDYVVKGTLPKDHPLLLRTSLLFPVEFSCSFPEEKEGFVTLAKESFFVTVKKEYAPGSLHSKGYHLLRLVFGDHILAFQGTEFTTNANLTENQLEMVIDYPSWAKKDKHGDMELAWYINHKPAVDIFVFGKKATIFGLDQPLTITDGKHTFLLTFTKHKGEGKVCGHISRANRKAQISREVEENFEAFDWEIGLRTLDRSEDFSVKATLSWLS
jgi:hypothetical protein